MRGEGVLGEAATLGVLGVDPLGCDVPALDGDLDVPALDGDLDVPARDGDLDVPALGDFVALGLGDLALGD